MNSVFSRRILVSACAGGLSAIVAAFAACSGNSTNGAAASAHGEGGAGADGAGGSDDGGAGGNPRSDAMSTVSTTPGSCPNPTVTIDFSPMYSAFIPGSSVHTFQIPTVTDDGNPATWSLSDPSQAQLVPQGFNGLPGAMITVQGLGTDAGQLTVFAVESDGTCGVSTLNITANTENDWQIGNARYNDGVALSLGPPAGFEAGAPRPEGGVPEGGFGEGGFFEGGAGGFRTSDGGSFFERPGGTACTNCHGPTATNGPFKDVSHTPEQTGGFSDSELIQIITQGNVPDGGYFDPAVILSTCDGGATCTKMAYTEWHSFHQWTDITPDEYPGIVVYLRSLQPEAQNGTANFGGGGGRRRDGGAGLPDGG